MKKVAVLGNSHVGSLKLAWAAARDEYPNNHLTYFASPGTKLSELKVSGGCLVPKSDEVKSNIVFTSEGLDRIDPAAYDAFILFGLGAKASLFHNNVFYSERARHTALVDRNIASAAFIILKKLRKTTEKPCFIAHDPLLARLEAECIYDRSVEYAAAVTMLNETLFAPLGTRMITQPAETMVMGQATDIGFCKGAVGIDLYDQHNNVVRRKDDRSHMNSNFGAHWLRTLFESIGS